MAWVDPARRVALITALTVLTAALAIPRGQQVESQPARTAPVPVAASTVAARPDAYYGLFVTLTAAVEEKLSKAAFTVRQDNTMRAGQDVLVLTPTLYGTVEPNAYVTIIGEVARFDAAQISANARGYTLDLPQEIAAKYRGRPAVLATAVITSAMIDLTKRLPPPLTAEEDAYARVMKQVGAAFAALRKGIETSNAAVTKENTDGLAHAFAEVETFWKTRHRADASRWAQDARKIVESIGRAAPGGNWEALKGPTGNLGQTCQACHMAYRERFDDGSFRIKTKGNQ